MHSGKIKSALVALLCVSALPALAEPQNADSSVAAQTFTAADNGKTVKVVCSDKFDVQLTGNMTTGFGWTVKDISGKAVEKIGDVKYIPEGTQRPGSGGSFLAHFKAACRGKSTLNMAYARPWEKGVKPAQEFSLTVNVSEKKGK